MGYFDIIIALLNKVQRLDEFIRAVTSALSVIFDRIYGIFAKIYLNFFFDTLDEDSILWWENLLEISPMPSQNLSDRRSSIHAKWIAKNHSDIKLIQNVCNAWKNGEVVADFVGGKIQITFVGSYGIPDDLDGLKGVVNEIKPAHLDLTWVFKYLLKKNIHQVMTKNEMQSHKKSDYCDVRVNGV